MRSCIRFRILVVCVLLLICPTSFFGQDKKEVVTIEGTVVAQDLFNSLQGCWHVCGFGLIVRLEGNENPEFVFVSVAFMDDRYLDNKGPHWKLIEKSSKWKFKAWQNDPPTILLEQFATVVDEETGKDITEKSQLNRWIPLKGSENVSLPYGRSLRSYSVGVGKFTSIK